MAFSIEIKDYATGPLGEVREGLSGERASRVVGTALAKQIVDHFKGLPGNKLGGRREFWEGAAKATSLEVSGDGGKVSVSQEGVRLRLLGGTIRAGARSGAKLLTIPARAETYGRRARDLSGLQFLWGIREGKPMPIALVAGKEGAARVTSTGKRQRLLFRGKKTGQGQSGLVMFWLVASVTQAGNRDVLPSDSELNTEAGRAAGEWAGVLARQAARGRAGQ